MINKIDYNIKINFDGKYYNQLLYADLNATWFTAKKFKRWKVLELLVKREKGVFHESIIDDYSVNEKM